MLAWELSEVLPGADHVVFLAEPARNSDCHVESWAVVHANERQFLEFYVLSRQYRVLFSEVHAVV